ncbi:hypothetical protein K7432_014056 [Basidiobolus ranarum]|uniref:Uncharacterized protein n=1 Tax=Basidiobolus ranarum TaxID=34480 RepID=A0ABR2VPZ4_9FUNG
MFSASPSQTNNSEGNSPSDNSNPITQIIHHTEESLSAVSSDKCPRDSQEVLSEPHNDQSKNPQSCPEGTSQKDSYDPVQFTTIRSKRSRQDYDQSNDISEQYPYKQVDMLAIDNQILKSHHPAPMNANVEHSFALSLSISHKVIGRNRSRQSSQKRIFGSLLQRLRA